MTRSTYAAPAALGKASASISVTSMSVDDPPPPPPPRQSKHRTKGGGGGVNQSHSLDTAPSLQSEDIPQSRYEEDNHSHDYSHDTSKSSRKYSSKHTNSNRDGSGKSNSNSNRDRDRARDRDLVSTASKESHNSRNTHHSSITDPPPPPPPPGQPPSSRGIVSNSNKRRDSINIGNGNGNGLGRIPELEDISPTSTRRSSVNKYEQKIERDDRSRGTRSSKASSQSTSNQRSRRDEKSVSSRNTKSSERRDNHRPSRGNGNGNTDADAESVDTEVLQYGNDGTNSLNNSTTAGKESVAARRRRRAQEAGDKTKPASSTSKKLQQQRQAENIYDDPPLELYSESESDDSQAADADVDEVVKKGKKKSGFSKVKKFIRMGNKASPKKNNKDSSPTHRKGRKTTISPGRNKTNASPKKKGFLSRLSLSPGKKRSSTPERKRGREVEKKDKKTRSASPFQFKTRSRSRSKPRVVVQDDVSNSKSGGSPNNSKGKVAASKKRPVTESTVRRSAEIIVSKEKLADNERKLDELAMRDDEVSKASARSRSSGASYHSAVSASRSEKKESAFEKLRREREEKRQQDLQRKKDDIQDSDVEIISGSNSDDMSEVTDPTYMTREARRNKSPVHDLEAVEEISSPESSPRHASMGGLDEIDQARSRSISPQSKDTRSTNRSKESKVSTKSTNLSPESKDTRNTQTSIESKKSRKSAQDDTGDSWNPDSFTGKENFVATIDPFQKAAPSTDPFDQPFYPSESQDEPQQMFSFVYSESDAELERGDLSKDTMTGLSFDSDEDGNAMDGLSYATPAGQSADTEVVKNGVESNKVRNKRRMLPPSNTFAPQVIMDGVESESPRIRKSNSVLDSFLGIDEDSGAVTLNVASQESEGEPSEEQEERPKLQLGKLSQRALSSPRSRRNKGFADQEGEAGKVESILQNFYPKTTIRRKSPEHDFVSESRKSPQSSLQHSPSFILERREKRKMREEEIARKARVEAKIDDVDRLALIRGKSDVTNAIERGRRRDQIFENAPKESTGPRTYSPEKMKFALESERDDSPTRLLANSTIRSPREKKSERSSEKKSFQETEGWINKPQYDTRKHRTGAGERTTPPPRTAFKAPAVFGKTSRHVPFKAPDLYARRTDPVIASVAHIKDPIQRAGTMILSAAAIPIQAEMRRYLAVKEREDRVWGIIVIQAYFRRWKAELTRYKYLYCATRIQAAFRGWLVRDTLEDKHYYATQIQKIARGYLATMSVYEDLYNITVVQSIVRRNAAIKRAEDRYKNICCIQGIWRGQQCRRELNYLHWTAIKIQTAFRGYTAKLNFQFDIVDIIIVQSIARRKAAINLAHQMRFETVDNAATVIQTYWRSYDCTMNYLHSVADILIAQSVVRRWMARRFVKKYRKSLHYTMSLRIQMCVRSWLAKTRVKKERAARDIQKVWRGFWGYTDFVFTLADIIIVQKTFRASQARKRVAIMAKAKEKQNQYNAAVTIQKKWRGYSAQMEMLFNLVHIIIVQSIIRRRIAIIKYQPRKLEHRAAIKIQRFWRTFSRKRNFMENYCATIIQAAVRRFQAQQLRKRMFAARKIQAWYRSQATSRGYLYYMSARKIQTVWRGYDARKLADEERWVREYAATTIQKTWRMFYQYSSYSIYKYEKKAATDIQRHWRGFWDYSHFVIMRYEASKIQALVRGTQQRKRLAQHHEAATVLQAAARGILAKKTCHMERLFSAMIYSSQISLSQRIAARKIQNAVREFRVRMVRKRAAIVIERFFIWVRAEVEREIERREKVRIRKRQGKYKESEGLLEDVYKSVNAATPTRSQRTNLKARMIASSPHKPRSEADYRHSHPAVVVNDTESVVSGLTTECMQQYKLKKKGHDKVDDDLEGAWREAKRKQVFGARPITRESQKENSSAFTPTPLFKVSARSLSRNRNELRKARG